jgi:hypothetical protein
MPRTGTPKDRSVELLERLILLQLHTMGATQDTIAKFLGRQKAWVNSCLKGVPRPTREGRRGAQIA